MAIIVDNPQKMYVFPYGIMETACFKQGKYKYASILMGVLQQHSQSLIALDSTNHPGAKILMDSKWAQNQDIHSIK